MPKINCPYCKKDITPHVHLEFGRSGGKATLKKMGKQHYKDMINKRWDNARKLKVKSV